MKILLAIDGSDASMSAVAATAALPLPSDAVVEIVSVVPYSFAPEGSVWPNVIRIDPPTDRDRVLDDVAIRLMTVADRVKVDGILAESAAEVLGINDRAQLAVAERALQLRLAAELMERGVTLADPKRLDVRGEVVVGRDVFIDVGVVLEGKVVLGDRTRLEAYAVVRNCTLGAGTVFFEGGEGIVDGMATDNQGNLYSAGGAGPGAVRISSREGKHLGTLHLPISHEEPRQPICATNVAFGDADGQSLFITACAAVYRIRVKVPGLRGPSAAR